LNPSGRNLRDVWTIATQPFSGAHFACYPERLVEPCILAATSEKGCCPKCWAPWERIVEKPDFSQQPKRGSCKSEGEMQSHGAGFLTSAGQAWQDWRGANPNRTTGWRPTCTCEIAEPISCTVCDPFVGSGTSAVVALRLGRSIIGIDLSADYIAMARRRIAVSVAKRGK
jgi:hypothetical protein